MIIVTLAVLIYIASAYGAYKLIQKAHYHENGKWNLTEPESSDIVWIFMPIFNVLMAVHYLMGGWKRESDTTTNFFKPKNK